MLFAGTPMYPSFHVFDKLKTTFSSVVQFGQINALNDYSASNGLQRSTSDSDLLSNKPTMLRSDLVAAVNLGQDLIGCLKDDLESLQRQDENWRRQVETLESEADESFDEFRYERERDWRNSDLWNALVGGEYASELRDALCTDLKGDVCPTQYYHVKYMDPFPFFEWMSENPEYVDLSTIDYESLGPLFLRLEQLICPRVQAGHPVCLLRDPVQERKCRSEFLYGLNPTCRQMVCRLARQMSNSISRKANSQIGLNPRRLSFNEHQGQVGSAVSGPRFVRGRRR